MVVTSFAIKDHDIETQTDSAIDHATCPPAFAAEVRQRLGEGRHLPLLAVCKLLLESPAEGGWAELRAAIVTDLATHPHDAVSVLSMVESALGWEPTGFAFTEIRQEGPPHAPVFTATCVFRWCDDVEVAIGRGRTAKQAKGRAAVVMLAKLAEVDQPAFEDVPLAHVPTPPAKALAVEGRNPVSVLMENAQARHVAQPRWRFTTRSGLPPVFVSACSYDGRTAEGTGATKREAKAAAARAMVATFQAPAAAAQ